MKNRVPTPAATTMQKINIIYDLGAVMIDWDPRYLYRQISDNSERIEYFLHEVISPAWNHRLDRGEEWPDIRKELLALYPEEQEWIDIYWDQWKRMLNGTVEGSVEILSTLKTSGYKLFALSNFNHHKYLESLTIFPFLHWFDGLIISGQVKLAKPEAAIYNLLLKTYDLKPEDCLFIDDKIENIEAAKTIGFNTILFKNSQQLRQELQSWGIHV